MSSDPQRPALRADALRRMLVAPSGPYADLDVVVAVPSTNTALVAAGRAGAPDRTVLVAEYQSAGRGRMTRSWVAPARSGLMLSVLLRPRQVPQLRWSWLPLLAGVVLCRTVAGLGMIPAALKWPNDLLLGPGLRKAGGILAEVVGAPPVRSGSEVSSGSVGEPVSVGQSGAVEQSGAAGQSGAAVVLGIGLNVTLRPDELPWTVQARALITSLAMEQAACTDREALLRELLQDLDRQVLAWCERDGDPDASGLREQYRKHCATLGRQVRVELPGKPALTGTAIDLDAVGRLVVRSAGRCHALAAGDVTHLRMVDPGSGSTRGEPGAS